MSTAVVHRETGVRIRSTDGDQNRAAIHLGLLRDTGAITNYSTGRITVWCKTIDAVRAARHVACAYGLTEVEVHGDMINRHGDATVRLSVSKPGVDE